MSKAPQPLDGGPPGGELGPGQRGTRFTLRVPRRNAAAAREVLALGLARREVEELDRDLRGELEPGRDED